MSIASLITFPNLTIWVEHCLLNMVGVVVAVRSLIILGLQEGQCETRGWDVYGYGVFGCQFLTFLLPAATLKQLFFQEKKKKNKKTAVTNFQNTNRRVMMVNTVYTVIFKIVPEITKCRHEKWIKHYTTFHFKELIEISISFILSFFPSSITVLHRNLFFHWYIFSLIQWI